MGKRVGGTSLCGPFGPVMGLIYPILQLTSSVLLLGATCLFMRNKADFLLCSFFSFSFPSSSLLPSSHPYSISSHVSPPHPLLPSLRVFFLSTTFVPDIVYCGSRDVKAQFLSFRNTWYRVEETGSRLGPVGDLIFGLRTPLCGNNKRELLR